MLEKASDKAPSIQVRNLTRTFHSKKPRKSLITANDNLTFSIQQGEIFGLLGPNGAGKTTLVHQLLGLLKPTCGSILVEGVDVIKTPEQAKTLFGFLPQASIPLHGLEVQQALHYTGRLRGQTENDTRRQVLDLIEQLGIEEYARRSITRLSGGMLRLVNFGMALMGQPRVLVLDEPTNELDPQNRRLVWDIIKRLNTQYGLTCILVTHNVFEAERVIQRVAVMQNGRFIAIGTPGDLKAQIGGKIRLEFTLKEQETLTLSQLDHLRNLGELEEIRRGQFRLFVPAQEVRLVDTAINFLGLERLDDFRLAPPSLEDVYLELGRTENELTEKSTEEVTSV
jgi:ABC-2 type transport system permease protein